MTDSTDEIGRLAPMTFPKRMMAYILADLTLINLICYYVAAKVPLEFVAGVTAIEIVALGIAFVFWVPRYQLKW